MLKGIYSVELVLRSSKETQSRFIVFYAYEKRDSCYCRSLQNLGVSIASSRENKSSENVSGEGEIPPRNY